MQSSSCWPCSVGALPAHADGFKVSVWHQMSQRDNFVVFFLCEIKCRCHLRTDARKKTQNKTKKRTFYAVHRHGDSARLTNEWWDRRQATLGLKLQLRQEVRQKRKKKKKNNCNVVQIKDFLSFFFLLRKVEHELLLRPSAQTLMAGWVLRWGEVKWVSVGGLGCCWY